MAIYLGTHEVSSTGTYNPLLDARDAVKFIDYDGTVLYSFAADDFLLLQEMPENPTHSGLIAQGWNWSLLDAQNFVSQWGFLVIGQMYTTTSGATEIKIKLLEGRLSPYLGLAINGSVTVNWGDGSSNSTITGTSLSTQIRTLHTYANPGEYTIKVTINNGSLAFYSNSSSYSLLSGNGTSSDGNMVYSAAVQSIFIGNGDINLKSYSFANCVNAEYITIPSTCSQINGSNIFATCRNLKSITIPSLNQTNLQLGQYTWSSDYNLKYCSFPMQVQNLGSGAFNDCYNLRILITPETASVTLPLFNEAQWMTISTLRMPSYDIQQNNSSLIITVSDNTKMNLAKNNPFITKIVIPEDITSINLSSVFYNNKALSTVSYEGNSLTLTNISSTFQNCTALNEIENINKIAFNASSLSSTFSSCTSLPSIDISNSTATSLYSTFMYCSSLNSVILPSTITTINTYSFYMNYSLRNITLPSSVTKIGDYSFYDCFALSSITIPINVTNIAASAFAYCYGLGAIHVKPTTPPTLGSNAFKSLPTDCTIYVPSASLSAYQSATGWSDFASQMVGE